MFIAKLTFPLNSYFPPFVLDAIPYHVVVFQKVFAMSQRHLLQPLVSIVYKNRTEKGPFLKCFILEVIVVLLQRQDVAQAVSDYNEKL